MKNELDRAAVLAPPPLLTVLCIIIGFVANHFKPIPLMTGQGPARFATSAGILLLAGGLIVSGIRQLVKSNEHPSPYKPTEAIVARGIYRFTRNPIYAGFLLVVLAIAIGANSAWLLLASVVLFLTLNFGVVRPEERYLSAKFGDTYRDYCRQVRRWL